MATARVLVVDDESIVLELTARVLGAAGFDVLQASTPRQALEIVRDAASPMDVVISDIVMPEMRGPQLVAEIRQLSPSTSAVLMSGYTEPAELPDGVAFLQKPFSVRDLIATVERVLSASASAQREVRQAREEAAALHQEHKRLSAELGQAIRESRENVRRSKQHREQSRKVRG